MPSLGVVPFSKFTHLLWLWRVVRFRTLAIRSLRPCFLGQSVHQGKDAGWPLVPRNNEKPNACRDGRFPAIHELLQDAWPQDPRVPDLRRFDSACGLSFTSRERDGRSSMRGAKLIFLANDGYQRQAGSQLIPTPCVRLIASPVAMVTRQMSLREPSAMATANWVPSGDQLGLDA